eukprot:4863670-Pyramimonas_sp.AAC.1
MRRCLSNVSAKGLGLALMRDLSHNTVSRWEVKLRASLNAANRSWARQVSMDLALHGKMGDAAPGWKFLFNQYRSDATNSHVWQDSKLHTTEYQGCYTNIAVSGDSDVRAVMANLDSRTIIGDLQIVGG